MGVELRYDGDSREHMDDILPANKMIHRHDIERPQPASLKG